MKFQEIEKQPVRSVIGAIVSYIGDTMRKRQGRIIGISRRSVIVMRVSGRHAVEVVSYHMIDKIIKFAG